jgi:uncharacterized repeat protein (TIGR01451 family)
MNVRSMILAAAVFLGASTHVWAAINDWTAIGPSGGTVNKIVFNKATPSTVYAIAAGGFYRSQDGGMSWQLIKSDFFNSPQDLAIDPSDSNRVYVVAPNYPCLYMSTDGGASLSAVTSLPTAVTSAWQIAVSQSGTTLYVTSDKRVFYSADRAITWHERTAVGTYVNARVLKLSIDPTDANTLYASATTSATDAGIFVTHDGAVTWQLLTSGNQSTSFTRDFAINAANSNQIWSARNDGIWVSNNKGVSWSNQSAAAFTAIAIDPSNPAILYAGTPFGSIYRTPDAGATWTDVADQVSAGPVATLAVNPSQTSRLLAGGLGGLSGTTNSGTQWSAQTAGLNSTWIQGFSADTASDRIYMSVESGGVYYSAAGAATTVPVNNVGSGGLLQVSGHPTMSVTAMLAQPGRLSASLSDGLARSADGGSTWSLVQVTPLGTTNQLFTLASAPADPQTILAESWNALYRSTDGGDLWTPVTAGLPANAVLGRIAPAASDPTIFYASVSTNVVVGPATYNGVYKSTDAGLTWAPANTGIASAGVGALAVDPSNAQVVYATTFSALLKTVDGGAAWKPITWNIELPEGIPFAVAIDPKHPSIVYASGTSRIARSVDGGASWQDLRAAGALPLWNPSALIADPKRPENILVGTTGGSGAQLFTIAPDLSLRVAAPASPVAVGAVATYNYTLSNLGPFDATGARVSVQLPATAKNISAVASGGTCAVAASVATCTVDIARVGVSNAIAVSASAPATGPFQLTASVLADQPDPDSSNNTVTTTASIANIADLSVTLTGSATVQVGSATTYTAVVKNTGPNLATAAQLTIQLAQGLTPGTATGAGATCTGGASGLFTCTLGDLVAAKSATVTINATAAVAGTQTSTAAVSSTTTDSVTPNNSATSSTAVTAVPSAPSKGGGGSLSIDYLLMLALVLIIQERAHWARKRKAW